MMSLLFALSDHPQCIWDEWAVMPRVLIMCLIVIWRRHRGKVCNHIYTWCRTSHYNGLGYPPTTTRCRWHIWIWRLNSSWLSVVYSVDHWVPWGDIFEGEDSVVVSSICCTLQIIVCWRKKENRIGRGGFSVFNHLKTLMTRRHCVLVVFLL